MSQTSSPSSPQFSEQAASLLATEHWSLLGTRSLAWNEAFSRTTVFLNVLSASVVALALVADATGFDESFQAFALVLFPIVLFLGIATYVRLVQINAEDLYLVAGMNRLRHAYLQIAPELKPYFTAGAHDDEAGITTTYLLGQPRILRPWQQFFVTTPTVVATIDAIVAASGAALLTSRSELASVALAAISVATFVVVWFLLFGLQFRSVRRMRQAAPRFPSTDTD